jgi:hypothetical protein
MTSLILTELVQAAMLMTYTLDVPGSSLDRDADCLDYSLSWFCSLSLCKYRDSVSN